MKISLKTLVFLATMVATPLTASADPPPAFNGGPNGVAPPAYNNGPNGYKQKEIEKKEIEKEKLEKLSDAHPGWKDPKGPPPGFDRKKAEERRKLEHKELMDKLAKTKITPEITAELKIHAQRVAELDRIDEIAKAKGDTASDARIQTLIARENARHDRVMRKLGAWK